MPQTPSRTDTFTTYDIYHNGVLFTPMTLAGHVFWVNANRFEMTTERIHKEVPTLNGVGRFSYGLLSIQYNLQGFTGNAGLKELADRQKGMGTFRPDFTNPVDQSYPLSFPARGLRNRKVYVDYFRDWMDSTMPNYYQYEIRLQEFAPRPPAYTQVLSGNAGPLRS